MRISSWNSISENVTHRFAFCVLVPGILVVCAFFAAPSAIAQSPAAKSRYGLYPLEQVGIARLKTDLRKDAALQRSNKAQCRKKKVSTKAGFCDGERDGLINRREKILGTNPRSVDTDGDGLRDRAELLVYGTDPLRADTDGDGVSDGTEILVDHTDPLVPSTGTQCSGPNFDQDGNTIAFGIPAPNVGNITKGESAYTSSCSACHGATVKGTNMVFSALKTRLSQAPMFITSLSNSTLSDLVAYLNRTQTGDSPECQATPTPNSPTGGSPITTPAATPIPGGSCSNQYFDAAGNTMQSVFAIPAALVGNVTRGATYFALHCASCHGERGVGFNYTKIKNTVTGPLMNITTVTDPDFADLTAYANRALMSAGCSGTPSTPTPVPTGGPTNTPTPTVPMCANQYFDASGNTTPNVFSIPSPLVGNIGQGSSLYSIACSSCHGEKGTGFTFSQLKTAVNGPLMNINTVTDQQFAHLTAFLNRALAAQGCGTPTPTPPPNPIAAGSLIFQVTCKSCHSQPSEFKNLSKHDLQEALNEVDEMSGITLSNEQINNLLAYLHSL